MSWWPFASTTKESVLPTSSPSAPSTGVPLEKVVVVANTPPVVSGATAPQIPTSSVGASNLMAGVLPQSKGLSARRGEYVALGGRRKTKGKGKSKAKSKGKSRKGKSSR
jgi:hypothetical protein